MPKKPNIDDLIDNLYSKKKQTLIKKIKHREDSSAEYSVPKTNSVRSTKNQPTKKQTSKKRSTSSSSSSHHKKHKKRSSSSSSSSHHKKHKKRSSSSSSSSHKKEDPVDENPFVIPDDFDASSSSSSSYSSYSEQPKKSKTNKNQQSKGQNTHRGERLQGYNYVGKKNEMTPRSKKRYEMYIECMQEKMSALEKEEYDRKHGIIRRRAPSPPPQAARQSKYPEVQEASYSSFAYCPGRDLQRQKYLAERFGKNAPKQSRSGWDDDEPAPRKDRYAGMQRAEYVTDRSRHDYDDTPNKTYSAVNEYWKRPGYKPPSANPEPPKKSRRNRR